MTTADAYDGLDPTEEETGLPSNFIARIENARFGYHPDIVDQNTGIPIVCLIFDRVSLDEDVPDDNEVHIKCGKGWEPTDGGKAIVRTDGQVKNPHRQTLLYLMVKSLLDGKVDVSARSKKLGYFTKASFWDGMVARWKRVGIDYKGDIGVIDRVLPVEIIKSTPKAAPKPEVNYADIVGKLESIAASVESFEEFQAQAYSQVPEVLTDDGLLQHVTDSALVYDNV